MLKIKQLYMCIANMITRDFLSRKQFKSVEIFNETGEITIDCYWYSLINSGLIKDTYEFSATVKDVMETNEIESKFPLRKAGIIDSDDYFT